MGGVVKWVLRIVLSLVTLAILAVAGFAGFVTVRLNTSLPTVSGDAKLPGAQAPIDIVRDRYGVPHIFAASEADLYRGLGYVHAQDRFVQMDLTRRAMQGRLSEVVGERALELDARARMLGWSGVADAMLQRISPQVRAVLDAYTQGVNAALASMPTPPEYALFLASAQPWRPEDSVAVGLAMTNELTSGGGRERDRAILSKVLSPQQVDDFLTAYPAWGARSYTSADLAGAMAQAARAGTGADGLNPGSNAWVVSGANSGTGKPVLANDPHLSLASPGPFYLSRLQGPEGPLIGASLPGAPMIVIGRTKDLAWGTTTHAVDTIDETPLTPTTPTTEARETIRVNMMGLFSRDVSITVRRTSLGPVLEPIWMRSEKSFAQAYGDTPVVVRSIALDPENGVIEAVYHGAHAKTVDAYFEALKPWRAPPQDLVVADSAGAIGLISPGRFPLRDADGAWVGDIPQRIMAKDAARGYFATANNLQTPPEFPYPMPGGHDPYRVTLIDEALAKDRAHDRARAAALQSDATSLMARRLIGVIAKATPKTPDGAAMRDALAAWDAVAAADRVEPTFFAYWTKAMGHALYADDLGETTFALFQGPREVFIDAALTGPMGQVWCDDKKTQPIETCSDTVGAALDKAAADMRKERGAEASRWRWGDVHAARFRNLVWSGLPLVGDRFTVTAPIGGNGSSVGVSRYRHAQGDFATVHAAGLRMVVDFADLNASTFMVTPGQSGHPLSPHYGDLAPLWAKGQAFEIRDDWGPDAPPTGAQRLRLTP